MSVQGAFMPLVASCPGGLEALGKIESVYLRG